jgi:hypothetical protein
MVQLLKYLGEKTIMNKAKIWQQFLIIKHLNDIITFKYNN